MRRVHTSCDTAQPRFRHHLQSTSVCKQEKDRHTAYCRVDNTSTTRQQTTTCYAIMPSDNNKPTVMHAQREDLPTKEGVSSWRWGRRPVRAAEVLVLLSSASGARPSSWAWPNYSIDEWTCPAALPLPCLACSLAAGMIDSRSP